MVVVLAQLASASARAADDRVELTVLYDAFGKASEMKKDWGFSAFIEYRGKRILFDTGNNAEIFAHNVKVKGIDLTKLDFAVASHRHGDHTSGLSHLLSVNPKVPIYAPKENFGVFGAALPGTFYKRDESLPAEMRYFDGNPPATMTFGSAWPDGDFRWVSETQEIVPGFHLLHLKGSWGVDLEVIELSLAIDTPDGIILIVGCSHPTLEKIVEAARAAIDKPVHLIFGGTHLLPAKLDEIRRVATALQETWHVKYIAPVHCTGEPAFRILKESFGDRYVYAGLGTTLEVGKDVMTKAEAGEPRSRALDETDFLDYRTALARGPFRALLGGYARHPRAADIRAHP